MRVLLPFFAVQAWFSHGRGVTPAAIGAHSSSQVLQQEVLREAQEELSKVHIEALARLLVGSAAAAFSAPSALSGYGRSIASPRLKPVMQEEAQVSIAERASDACDGIVSILADDSPPPKNLVDVKEAIREGKEDMEIGAALYLLLVEQTLDYDLQDGKLVPTTVDYSKTDDMAVIQKMSYIYNYGIGMLKKGYIKQDALMDAVLKKVAGRVNMDGPAFDKWLQVPKVEVKE